MCEKSSNFAAFFIFRIERYEKDLFIRSSIMCSNGAGCRLTVSGVNQHGRNNHCDGCFGSDDACQRQFVASG